MELKLKYKILIKNPSLLTGVHVSKHNRKRSRDLNWPISVCEIRVTDFRQVSLGKIRSNFIQVISKSIITSKKYEENYVCLVLMIDNDNPLFLVCNKVLSKFKVL